MKSAYVICAILGMTIGTLVLAQNGAVQTTPIQVLKPSIPPSSAESSKNITDSGFNLTPPTTAEPSLTTHESTTLNTSTVITTTTSAPTTATTNSTTAAPNKTTITSPITTTTPTTPTPAPTSPKPKPTSPAPQPTATPTDAAKTTATPVTPPSSKDRQFDGLSFFGGIVLTTCLMAIAAFSWRFYRQCKEGNYRTL